MDWSQPPPDFHYVIFERIDPARNMARYYVLGWMPTLFDADAVVRIYGRKGGAQKIMSPQPFNSLDEAWPLIQSITKTRLRHGYRIVLPQDYGDEDELVYGSEMKKVHPFVAQLSVISYQSSVVSRPKTLSRPALICALIGDGLCGNRAVTSKKCLLPPYLSSQLKPFMLTASLRWTVDILAKAPSTLYNAPFTFEGERLLFWGENRVFKQVLSDKT